MTESYDWFDALVQEVEAKLANRKLRRDNPYVRDIVKVLWPYQRGLHRRYVVDRVWSLRNPTGLPMPKAFEQTVQSAFNQHNEESSVFRKKGGKLEDALFYPFGGKGSGVWAVRHDRAEAWLRRKALEAAS